MIICHPVSPRLPPAVCLAERLADDHRDCTLAVPLDCQHKINFVHGGKEENTKSALCGLYEGDIRAVTIDSIFFTS